MNSVKSPCNCGSCGITEKAGSRYGYSYRMSLTLKESGLHYGFVILLVVLGTVLTDLSVGPRWLMAVPLLSFITVYILNSFTFCATCSYHHSGVKICGCFPKSVFSYKREKPWSKPDNIIGWPLIMGLLTGPVIVALSLYSQKTYLAVYLVYVIGGIILQAVVTCKNCRQRGVCFLGMASMFFRGVERGNNSGS